MFCAGHSIEGIGKTDTFFLSLVGVWENSVILSITGELEDRVVELGMAWSLQIPTCAIGFGPSFHKKIRRLNISEALFLKRIFFGMDCFL